MSKPMPKIIHQAVQGVILDEASNAARQTVKRMPLMSALLIALIASLVVIVFVIAAKMIRDDALPHYVSAVACFVFGFAGVLVLRTLFEGDEDDD